MFSFRPGLAYIGMSIAIWIVMAIVYFIVGAIFLGTGDGMKNHFSAAGALSMGMVGIAVSFLLSLAVIFGMADAMMPSLCRWVGEHKKHTA